MTTTSGDVGVTESEAQLQHSSSLDPQHVSDFLSLFTDQHSFTSTMDFETFSLDDNPPVPWGASQDGSLSDPTSADAKGSISPSVAHRDGSPSLVAPSWAMMHNPPTFDSEQTAFQPGPWLPGPRYEQPTNFGFHGGEGRAIQMPLTSNPVDLPTYPIHNRGLDSHSSPIGHGDSYGRQDFEDSWTSEQSAPPHEGTFDDDGNPDSLDGSDPCYAQLLYRCLKEAPSHMLSLRELYEWVMQHSQKAKDPHNRGWQNSVRHNLSMNAVSNSFLRVRSVHCVC